MRYQRRPGIPAIGWLYAIATAAVITVVPACSGGPDDIAAAQASAQDNQAAAEDAAAQASRDWAAAQVCGPQASPQWVADKELVCIPHSTTLAKAQP